MPHEHFDVLIVGAGLSGIGAGYHLQANCRTRTFAILEARDASGGTWDLFRYPGIRSDSDMYTLGYSFRPWTHPKAIADGPSILEYIRDTARAYSLDEKIRFRHRVTRATWSSERSSWIVEVERDERGELVCFTCNFLFMCSGYYSYKSGYTPQFPGVDSFTGRIIHPQSWPEDLDYAGKRVIVIGSGATAVTLVPELAKTASHVIMLQRSPTYIVSRPAEDRLANFLRRRCGARIAYAATRWKNVLLGMIFFRLCKRSPARIKGLILKGVRKALGSEFDVDTHFTPRYAPWDQRLCLVPDGDLFEAIKNGRASVVTDHVDTFTSAGIKLGSSRELEADIIVTATGLELELLGGLELTVDGKRVDLSRAMTYKGMMFSDVPNLAIAVGYTNASWTLKCDLTCEYVCRLLNHMQRHGFAQCTPRCKDAALQARPWIDFSSGYVLRSIDRFPKQGSKAPWRLHQNYALDLMALRFGSIEDGAMEFISARPENAPYVFPLIP